MEIHDAILSCYEVKFDEDGKADTPVSMHLGFDGEDIHKVLNCKEGEAVQLLEDSMQLMMVIPSKTGWELKAIPLNELESNAVRNFLRGLLKQEMQKWGKEECEEKMYRSTKFHRKGGNDPGIQLMAMLADAVGVNINEILELREQGLTPEQAADTLMRRATEKRTPAKRKLVYKETGNEVLENDLITDPEGSIYKFLGLHGDHLKVDDGEGNLHEMAPAIFDLEVVEVAGHA